MKITLKMNNVVYDITDIVDTNNTHKDIEMELTTEGEFHTGSLIIPIVKRYEKGNQIDFSRGLIRNSLITIERDGISTEWRIMGDTVQDNLNDTYTHSINLIDRRSETTGFNLPALTLTQPKSVAGKNHQAIFGMNETDYSDTPFYDRTTGGAFWNTLYQGYNITQANQVLPLNKPVVETGDKSLIDGLELKEAGRKYFISLSFNAINSQINYTAKYSNSGQNRFYGVFGSLTGPSNTSKNISDISYTINIRLDGKIIKTEDRVVRYADTVSRGFLREKAIKPTVQKVEIPIDITPKNPGVLSVDISVNSEYRKKHGHAGVLQTERSHLLINDLSLRILTNTEDEPGIKNLDEWVERLLNHSVPLNEEAPYKLSEISRNKLSEITAPEFTIQNYNLYQGIQEVASFLGSSWEIDENNELNFLFFDDPTVYILGESIELDDKGIQANIGTSDLNDYMSSVKLNAENVSSNNLKIEKIIRPTSNGSDIYEQITDTNLMIPTDEPINYVDKLVVQGMQITVPGSSYVSGEPVDITNRILTKEEWDLLDGNFDPSFEKRKSGRSGFTKSNTLYFIRGEKGIHGLGYTGGVPPKYGSTENYIGRSVFETVAAELTFLYDINVTDKDKGLETTNNTLWNIEYYPFTSSQINIYKDDQTGFQLERSKYFNESDRLNSPDFMGDVAQNTVNRLGGTEYTITGYVDSLQELPPLGSVDDKNRRLTKIVIQTTDDYVRYTASYTSDYTKFSKFVGIKSDYRLYEIPNTSIIKSTRLIRDRIIFGSNIPGSSLYTDLISNLGNQKKDRPIIAKLQIELPLEDIVRYKTVTSNEFGKSASWSFSALDNYAIGYVNTERKTGGADIKYRQSVPYTDFLGNINSVKVSYGTDYGLFVGPPSPDQITDYPHNVDMNEDYKIGWVNYDKDAREILSIEHELSFGSADVDKYRIYSGITRHNTMITGDKDFNIVCRTLDYIPNKGDRKVNLARVGNLATVSIGPSYISVKSNTNRTSQGFIFYEEDSNDILFVLKDNISSNSTHLIPYGRVSDLGTVTVKFNTNGGHGIIETQTIPVGSSIPEPIPSRLNYSFQGWYTDIGLTNLFNFNTSITNNTTLYAKWKQNEFIRWESVNTTLYDDTVRIHSNSFNCPLVNPRITIGSANNYPLGTVIRVLITRECDTNNDICFADPLGRFITNCPTVYFKVVK